VNYCHIAGSDHSASGKKHASASSASYVSLLIVIRCTEYCTADVKK